MTTLTPKIHDQSIQNELSSAHSAGNNHSGSLNSRDVRCDLSRCFARIFATVKKYFQRTPASTPKYSGHTIDVERAGDFDSKQDGRYHSTMMRVVFIATTVGLATTACMARSALYASSDTAEQNFATPDTLTVTLTTTALVGRRLLSAPTVTNAITNQSVFPKVPFNLQIDLSKVFSFTGNLGYVHCSQIDGTPLPDWLTMSLTPTLMGSVAASAASDVVVVDNYAYVADLSAGLRIIDVSNKTRPVLIGSLATYTAFNVVVVDNYAYIADSLAGLKIIDVSNKTSPALIGSISTSSARDLAVADNYVYVADFDSGLKIIDVSNKTHPVLVGNIPTTCINLAITVVDNYGYFTDANHGLKVIDLSNKTSPMLVGIEPSSVISVTVVGDYAYTTNQVAQLMIIDVSNKSALVLVGQMKMPCKTVSSYSTITVVGNYAYIADDCAGLVIADISNKTKPTLCKSIANPSARGVTVVDNYIYATNYTFGLDIFSANIISLSGTPALFNRGTLPIKLTITDALGETASVNFGINVLNHAPIAPTINPRTVHHAFDWIIPEFSDSDGDSIIYSATSADGSPLPDWISLNPITRNLSGVVPPVVTVRNFNIQANDSFGGIANASQTITVTNFAPYVCLAKLTDQFIQPRMPFNFSLDDQLFGDNDGDPLIYSATLQNQQSLPDWLAFNPINRAFTGNASICNGSISLIVTATDPFGAMAAHSFNLMVGIPVNPPGNSGVGKDNNDKLTTVLAIKITSAVASIFLIGVLAYAKSNVIWKKSMKCLYSLPTEYVVFGQESEYCHSITHLSPDKVASVKLLRNGQLLPDDISLPAWLIYDISSGKLTIDAKTLKEQDQDELSMNRWTIQVKNRGFCVYDLIREEFDIEFVRQFPEMNDKLGDISDNVALRSVKNRYEQLTQPLIPL